MSEWIAELVTEIDQIDDFFCQQFDDYANQFIDMQAKYLQRIRIQEDKHQKKERRDSGKKSTKNQQDQSSSLYERDLASEDGEGEDVYVSPIDGRLIDLNKRNRSKNKRGTRNQEGDARSDLGRRQTLGNSREEEDVKSSGSNGF
mmetsp:Transcript_13148/g.22249  ORF Transcript_13148/g.22249 Transcript_13148/m.22249 type:complete len:145 (-) Transcript_13148:1942-2376(-)